MKLIIFKTISASATAHSDIGALAFVLHNVEGWDERSITGAAE